jgi:hypothetical protein
MKINVDWCTYRDGFDAVDGSELLVLDPVPVLKYYQDNDGAQFKKCPAYINYYKNTYVICSPIDVEIEINREENWANIITPPRLPKDVFNPRFGDEGTSPYPLFSLRLNRFLFTTETKDVYIETSDPTLEWNRNHDIRIISGNFNISRWVRPVEPAFEHKSKHLTIKFERGQPMYYVRFVPSNPDDIVVLNKKEMNKELFNDAQRCLAVKEFKENSSLQFLYGLRDKFIKGK